MSLTYDTINAFVQDNVMPVLVDNIFYSNIITYRFLKKAKKWRGGENLQVPIEYAESSNAESYSGATALSVDNVEFATKATLPVRQYNCAITINGIEEEEVKGDPAVGIDLVKSKTKNAEKSLKELFGDHFFSTQTGTNYDGVGGVFAATSGTSYAGINPADFSGWESNGGNGSTAVSGNLTETLLNTHWNYCRVDNDKPTLIVTTDAIWAGIEETFFSDRRKYEDKKMANLGFDNITFHGTPITNDSHCTAQALYYFNEKYLSFYVMPGMNFKFIPFQYPTNQDVKIAHIRWYGNLLCSNVYKQGQLTSITGVA